MTKLCPALLFVLLTSACESPRDMPTDPTPDGPLFPAPQVANTNAKVDLTGTFWNGCSPGEEYVDVAGAIHLRSQWKYDPDTGILKVTVHENMQGVSGAGQSSGLKYQVMQIYNRVDIASPGPEYDADRHLKMRMTSQGNGDNPDFHVIYNIHYDPVNGSVFTLRKLTIECQG